MCALPGKTVPEMTNTVSGGTLNLTHSLTHVFNHVGKARQNAVTLTCTHRRVKFDDSLLTVVEIRFL